MKKPFKTYNGGKAGAGVYQNIINNIPLHDVYIEPMVGNGGVFHNLRLPPTAIINDIDPAIVAKYIFKININVSNTRVLVFNHDYAKILLGQYDDKERLFFYFDPPYHFDTRKSKRSIYKYEWSHEQHVEFLELANTIKSDCMISHYQCELYDTMLKGWRTFDFPSMTRNGLRTERIYMNYPEPEVLQDYRYTGADYRERQRIKRKVNRHIERLENLPVKERNAIISSIIAKYGATAASFIQTK